MQSPGHEDDETLTTDTGYDFNPPNCSLVIKNDVPDGGSREKVQSQGLMNRKCWNIAREFHLWIKTLKEAFGAPFLVVIIIVYGISQGYAGTVRSLAANYYWKDVQKLQPASSQAFQAIAAMPWSIKPAYGLITDTFPIAGFQRWPYLAICGIAGACCLWALWLFSAPSPWFATFLMASLALCTAFPDVVVDAAIAEKSRNVPTLASDLQSLSWGSLSVGGLIGCTISGPAVHQFGPKGSFLLISIAPLMLLVAAWALQEKRLPKGFDRGRFRDVIRTLQLFGHTLQDPILWKPALYIYLSQGLCPDISEAMFYWFTDPKVGPGFSPQFIGLVSAIGYLAMFVGVAMYNCWFRFYTFRTVFFWPQVAYCALGLLDIVIVTRLNLILGIPDHAFVIGDEALTDVIHKLQLVPVMVLSAKLCPPGIEGTIFAFLMSVSNFGAACGDWLGAIVLKMVQVQRENYSNLWLAVLIRSIVRLTPLLFLFLLPTGAADDIQCPQLQMLPDSDANEESLHILKSSQELVNMKQ